MSSLTVSGALNATLATAAQPNITSIGTLSSLTVSGALNATLTTAAQPNITSVGNLSNLTMWGNIDLTGNNIVNANNIGGTLTTAAQPNITSVGNLSTLNVGTSTANIEVMGSNSSIVSSLQLARGSATSYQISNDGGNFEISQYQDGVGSLTDFYTYTGNSHRFSTNGTEKVRIDSNGNVGIGTVSPTKPFEVNGTNASMVIRSKLESEDSSLYFDTPFNISAVPKTLILAEGQNSFSRSKLHFCLNNNADNTTEVSLSDSRMTIIPSGNVGIKTGDPVTSLHVKHGDSTRDYSGLASQVGLIVEGDVDGILLLTGPNNRQCEIWFGDTESDSAGRLRYEHTLNKFEIWTNGAERFSVDSVGNTAMNGDLTVSGGQVGIGTPNSSISLAIGDSDTGIDWVSDGIIRVMTNGQERMRINHIGQVGIGTNSPSSTLQVGPSTISNPSLPCSIGGSSIGSILQCLSLVNSVTSGTAGTGTALAFHNAENYSATGRIITVQPTTGTAGDMYFETYNSGLSEKMRITSGGNVGIGTNAPTSALHIKSGTAPQLLIENDNFNPNSIKFQSNRSDTNIISDMSWFNTDVTNVEIARIRIQKSDGADGNGEIQFHTANGTTLTERMRIARDGNVGLGAFTPSISLAIGDSDTGIDWVSEGIIKFMANNQEKIRISTVGVGIGNIFPSFPLDVNGEARMIGIVDSTIDGGGVFTDTFMDRTIRMVRNNNTYRAYTLGLLGNNTTSSNKFAIGIDGGNGANPDPQMSLDSKGRMVLADGLSIGTEADSLTLTIGDSDTGIHWVSDGNLDFYANNVPIMRMSSTGFGLGVVPSYQLQLSTNSAAKPGSSTWTISSDRRLKENIIDADLDICYDDIKKLPLRKFKWQDNYIEKHSMVDTSNLGFIAQEVELIYPKSVSTMVENEYGLVDVKSVDKDQLIMSLFGAVKKLQNKSDISESQLQIEKSKVSNLEYELAIIKAHLGL